MSLNRQYLGQYIERHLQQQLEAQGLELDKDWTKLTNTEAEDILKAVEVSQQTIFRWCCNDSN